MRHFNLNLPAVITASLVMGLTGGLPLLASDMDGRIESAAMNSYNFRTYLANDDIKVASSAGVVTLMGNVPLDYHKTLAQDTVEGLPGVKSVINLLVVAGDQPSERSDNWITMKVKTALTFHKQVSATETGVHTQDGIVTLTGTAGSEAKKELTGEYAKDVEGVTEVRNEIIVANGKPLPQRLAERVDDASITAQLKTTLLFHRSTHTMATKVTTRNGVVTLHGEALYVAEKNHVTRIAEDIKGVREVNNLMTLRKG
jgi:osmotically-inducible protein OsmY